MSVPFHRRAAVSARPGGSGNRLHLPSSSAFQGGGDASRAISQASRIENTLLESLNRPRMVVAYEAALLEGLQGLAVRYLLEDAQGLLGCPQGEFDDRLQLLCSLFPDTHGDRIAAKFSSSKVLAEFIYHTGSIAINLVQLKQLFPGNDVSTLISGRPSLLLPGNFDKSFPFLETLAKTLSPEECSEIFLEFPDVPVRVLAEFVNTASEVDNGMSLYQIVRRDLWDTYKRQSTRLIYTSEVLYFDESE